MMFKRILMFGGVWLGVLLMLTAGFLTVTAAPEAVAALPVIDDFEGGVPGTWFQYGDYGSGTVITTNAVPTDTVPGKAGGTNVLEVGYTSAGWGAGTGNNLGGQDWSSFDGFSFWFKGANTGGTFRVILSDNPNPAAPGDSAERFAYEFVDNSTGWRHVSIPWGAFFRDPSFQPGGAPDDGLTLTEVQAYAIALPVGTAATVFVDDVRVFKNAVIDDFEGGVPGTWFQYGDYGSGTAITTNAVPTDTVPGKTGGTNVLEVGYTSAGWGAGTGNNLGGQDWSSFDGFSFWFKGANTGGTFRVILSDNPNPAAPGDSAERFAYEFVDNSTGWRHVSIPWGAFFRDPSFQPGGAPDDGLTLTEVQAYAIALPIGTAATVFVDDVALFGGLMEVQATFAERNLTVTEGNPVTLTVSLNMTSTNAVSVDYATVDGTAIAGSDYVAAAGTVTIPAGTFAANIIVTTLDEAIAEASETFQVVLSNPVSVSLTSQVTATVTIEANDQTPPNADDCTIVDDYAYTAGLPAGVDGNGLNIGFATFNAPGASASIALAVPGTQVPDKPANNQALQMDLNLGAGQWGGFIHTFENSAVDTWVSQDWSSYEGVCFWLYGNDTGSVIFVDVLDNRNPGSTTDDAERWSVDIPDDFTGWQLFKIPFSRFNRKDIGNSAPFDGFGKTEIWGYGIGGFNTMTNQRYFVDDFAVYGKAPGSDIVKVAFAKSTTTVTEGETAVLTVSLSITSTAPVTVTYRSMESSATTNRDYVPVDGVLVFEPGAKHKMVNVQTIDDQQHELDESVMINLYDVAGAEYGFQRRTMLTIEDNDPEETGVIDDFTAAHPFATIGGVTLALTELGAGDANALPDQQGYAQVLTVQYNDAMTTTNRIYTTFAEPQDWSDARGLSFWYFGNNTGETVQVNLWDNQITTTNDLTSTAWVLRWADEFNDPAGTLPNPNRWKHEIGDGTLNGIPGWGNSEFQFYTDDPANAATDGAGNLVIRISNVNTATTDLICYYGPCRYTSARLITQDRAAFQYGRLEARMKLPPTDQSGLWPAFWALGDNIRTVDWPQSGEIDVMEYVSRIPDEIFGTLHGPGYSGGASYGRTINIPNLTAGFHTYAVEWRENHVIWTVDGVKFHEARDTDPFLNGKEWVFNHPFFLLLNMAIGGNFGGTVSDQITFPQDTLVDYVRVYQAPNSAELFEAGFVDNFTGWKQIVVPFTSFTRSAMQPAGAPNDGLTLTAVNGYGFTFPSAGTSGRERAAAATITTHIDQVRLINHVRYLPIIGR
jgi:beta-glucanase (GH16 family)